MSNLFTLEEKDGFYLLSNVDFDADSDCNTLLLEVKELLAKNKMDIVLSLDSVSILYSSHLAIFVRLQQLLHKNDKKLIITDISQELRNLLQITQLESILSIYSSLDEFLSERAESENRTQKIPFEWALQELDYESVLVKCKGAMIANESLANLQRHIDQYFNVSFNFSELTEIDNPSITFLIKFSDTHQISVSGVNPEILEQFKQCCLSDKIKII